jgi:hypothetical protein
MGDISVTLGGIPLDVVETFDWPMYMGAKGRPVALIQGGHRYAEFAALGVGPHVLTFTAPKGPGPSPESETVSFGGIYMDFAEASTFEACVIRLYDRRFLFRERMWPLDFNVTVPDEYIKYQPGTVVTPGVAVTFEQAVADVGKALGLSEYAIEEGLETLSPAARQRVLPDDLLWSGRMPFWQGLDEMLALVNGAVTVDGRGYFRFVDLSERVKLPETSWADSPSIGSRAVYPGAAKRLDVRYRQKIEIKAETISGVASSGEAGKFDIGLIQVFANRGTYVSIKGLAQDFDAYTASSSARGSLASVVTATNPLLAQTLWNQFIGQHYTSELWEGTPLQAIPYDTSPAEIVNAALARKYIAIIRRDWRLLYMMADLNQPDPEPQGTWYRSVLDTVEDVKFGVLDTKGNTVQSGFSKINNATRYTVEGDWLEGFAYPTSPLDLTGTTAAETGTNNDEDLGPPFGVKWEDEEQRVIRLVYQPTFKPAEFALPGSWRTIPAVRLPETADFTNPNFQASSATRFLTPVSNGIIDPDYVLTVGMTATVTNAQTVMPRYYTYSVPGTDLGEREVQEIMPSESLFAVLDQLGGILNLDEIKKDAERHSARYRAQFSENGGVGLAHGVGLALALEHPRGNVAAITIKLNGKGAGTIMTEVETSNTPLPMGRKKAIRETVGAVRQVQGGRRVSA